MMVRSVFHLTLRATEGFLRSLFHLLEWELPVPDYTTLCKRAKRLGVSLGRKAAGPLHLVLDSTGLKVFPGRENGRCVSMAIPNGAPGGSSI